MIHHVPMFIPVEFRFFVAAVVLAVIVVAIGAALAGAGAPKVRARPLLTDRERAALAIIERILPHARIYVQVSMGALLQPARGTSKRNYMNVRNRFSQKMVDFVAEDRASGAILALIELDDRSHNPIKDIMRDRMTASAGYHTIRLPSGRLNQAEIASRLQPLIPVGPRPTLPPQMMPR